MDSIAYTALLADIATLSHYQLSDVRDAVARREADLMAASLRHHGFAASPDTTLANSGYPLGVGVVTVWEPGSGDPSRGEPEHYTTCDVATARTLLDTVRNLPDPAAAYQRWTARLQGDRITNEVATMLGVDTRTVQRRAAAAGVGRRVGTTLVFTPAEVDRLAEARPRGRPAGSIRRALGLDAEAARP